MTAQQANKNQYQLLTERRFLPYFGVQFLGAFNDNLFKTALLMLISITFATLNPAKANVLNNLGAALFIFPFFIFSATAGQLADKYEKKSLIHIIKFAEILLGLLIAVGFYLNNITFLLGALFLLGTQAAFFSPVKYSILPQYLSQAELLGGNGMVEMGTFVAILTGTILGGLLISQQQWSLLIPITIILIAMLGWLCSLLIPASLSKQQASLKINWDPFSQTYHSLKEAARHPFLFWIMLAISWFWFYGTILITQIPNYTRLFLGGTPYVMTLMLSVASIGIGIGSLACEHICQRKVKMGLVTVGAIGLTAFAIDISFIYQTAAQTTMNLSEFIVHWQNWRLLMDLFLIGIFGGFYSVPLYVVLQIQSEPANRSQVIAANNILNALLMTVASIFAMILLKSAVSIPQLFLILGILNAVCMLLFITRVPAFLGLFFKRHRV